MSPPERVPISERVLIQRINSRLRSEGKYGWTLRRSRGLDQNQKLGKFYILDFDTKSAVSTHINIEDLGRELKVLQEWEFLVEKNKD